MATRYGWDKTKALVSRGWKIKKEESSLDEMRFGDPILLDPLTGREYTPYEAEKLQDLRDYKDGKR